MVCHFLWDGHMDYSEASDVSGIYCHELRGNKNGKRFCCSDFVLLELKILILLPIPKSLRLRITTV